jgi:hypothetical protein
MKTPIAATLLFGALALAACTQDAPADIPAPSPTAQVTGPPVNCLSVTAFSSTRIRDDYTIDFVSGTGSKAWRVTLPNRCSGLKSANSFTYETSLSQLCRQDIVYPLQQIGGSWQRMGGCGMGPFVPVKLAK